jgi:hypothetical protein
MKYFFPRTKAKLPILELKTQAKELSGYPLLGIPLPAVVDDDNGNANPVHGEV